MPEVFLVSQEKGKQEWVPIDDPVRDEKGNLLMFGIQMPTWARKPGYQNVHLVSRNYPLGDMAVTIWDSSTRLTSSRSLLKFIEEKAREANWYDAEKYPSVREHAGKLGMIIASATLLHKYLKNAPFQNPGYYNGKHELVLGGEPINVDSADYRR